MKKFLNIVKHNTLFGIIIGIVICSLTFVIAESINSNEVLYDNSNSSSNSENVQDALDDLYGKVVHENTGYRLLGHIDNSISGDLIGGLYRYQGVQDNTHNVNNYICFGTTDKNTCIGDTDKYMYRIMGFSISGQMKLIKKEALNTAYKWNSSGEVDWIHSDLYSSLNGSIFLTNTAYVPDSTWSNRIANSIWHYGDVTNVNMSALEIYNLESNLSNTINAKIGLMYMHDYNYGLPGGTNCGNMSNQTTCITSWIDLSHNDASPPIPAYEWVITRNSNYYAWCIINGSYLGKCDISYYPISVRPVFFLNSSETIASGSGTITDPYILS